MRRRAVRVAGRAMLACVLMTGLGPATAAPASDDFGDWLSQLRAEGETKGLSESLLTRVIAQAKLIPRVIELDRRQPEFTLSFAQYRQRVIPASRVRKAQKNVQRHQSLLRDISARYHVQPRFIVALWGIETDFGRAKGGFPVINSLLTLAHDGRRSEYFRGELFQALRIVDEGHISLADMIGSWAGAMGQVQFMPSSFNRFAVDYDGDGRRDIWNNTADALASAANYLARSGWKDDQTWGRQVKIPADFDQALIGRTITKPMREWQALGVRRHSGGNLPGRNLDGSLVQPGGADGPTYLVYENYHTILKWNRSDYFATAVGLLSDQLRPRQ